MKLLPRYTFRTTGELCPHGVEDCLCDVHVTEPVEIRRDLPHMFYELVLQELDYDLVCDRNVVEFFSIVLGCYETYLREVHDEADSNVMWTNVPPEGKAGSGPAAWQALPVEQRVQLRRHANAGTPWTYAMIELEDHDIGSKDMNDIRKFYNDTRRNAFHAGKKKVVRPEHVCESCGAGFVPSRNGVRYCSLKCNSVEYYRRKAEATCEV
jgi:uncharacterized OB-fold protein